MPSEAICCQSMGRTINQAARDATRESRPPEFLQHVEDCQIFVSNNSWDITPSATRVTPPVMRIEKSSLISI